MRKWGNPPLSTLAHAETRPEVQHALFLVWHAANRICAKRLLPFLPTFVEAAYTAWVRPPRLRVPQATAFHERSDSGSPPAFPA